MKTTLRLALAAAALAAAAACTLQTQDAPAPTGPSEFALSLDIRATPDVIMQDGGSQSVITITARDHNSQPVAGLSLLVQTQVNGMLVDYGELSARSIVTGTNGVATVVYTAPAPPPPTATSDAVVTIVVTPLGTNYDSTFARGIGIRLARPGVILPPNGTPVASFTFAPSSPRAGDEVAFDASDSTDDGEIVRYEWNWGDGDFESTTSPTIQKDYEISGTFSVRLTVVDDRGLSASSVQSITVGAEPTPTAVFTFSPDDPAPGDSIVFNATESTAPQGAAIVSYRWNFGDGTAEVTTTSRTVQHTFNEERTYVVTLTVTDSEGRRDSTSESVTVVIPTGH